MPGSPVNDFAELRARIGEHGGRSAGDTDDEKAQSLVRAMLAAGLAEKL